MGNNQNSELEEFGKKVEEIIDSAINSSDYKQLSETINKAIEKAIDTGSQALRDALAGSPNGDAYKRNRYVPPEEFRQGRPKKEQKKSLYAKVGGDRAMGGFMAVGGVILAIGTGLGIITNGLFSAIFSSGGLSPLQIFLAIFFAGGCALAAAGSRLFGKTTRFRQYVKTIGDKTYCDVEKLSRAAGKPVKYVRKDIKGMISKGWFLEGHLDGGEKTLITSDETYEQYREIEKQRAEQSMHEAAENAKKPVVTAETQEIIDKGNQYLREIHACNEAIPGEEISAQIAGIENLVATILQRAENHPQAAGNLKKMMNYYLPMTIKLLKAYEEMDRQPVQGENILNSKHEIEETLTTLNLAFEKLLDSSFGDTALDVSSDISVLNTLLAQEGLKDDGLQAVSQGRF